MRRFPVVARPRVYLGVAPDAVGAWTFWQDRAAEHGCARYFSAAVSTSTETEIVLDWPRPDEIRVRVPEVQLDWRSTMVATTRSRVFNAVGSVLPDAAWRSPRLLGDGAAGRHPARPRASPHGRLSQQAGLGEFLLPQQGVFALGRAFSR